MLSSMGGSTGELSEVLVTQEKWKKGWRAHSPTFPSLHLRHNSFSISSVAFPTSQLIFQPFRCFTYVAELILQPFRHFTYVTTHSPTLPSLSLRHSSLSNPSVASPTSQFILQPSFHFSYVTSSSLNSPDEPTILSSTLQKKSIKYFCCGEVEKKNLINVTFHIVILFFIYLRGTRS